MSLVLAPTRSTGRSAGSSRHPELYLVHPVGPRGRALARAVAPSGAWRLTRRGRVVARVALSLLVVLALLGGVLLLNRPAEAGSRAVSLPVTYRVVLPGQTLWQIAGQVAPGVDRRETVARIVELNALSSAAVFAGQRIAIPVRGS